MKTIQSQHLPERWQRDENRHVFFAFPPKAQNQLIKAGLLAHLIFAGLLIPCEGQWHSGAKTFSQILSSSGQTDSCGDSSGFTPDSLLIPSAEPVPDSYRNGTVWEP